MPDFRVEARPYEIGSSVTSVELLLEARTRAEEAATLATRQLAASTGVEGPIEVTSTKPGPAVWADARKFVAEAPAGMLGALLISSRSITVIADLIMGGRGLESDEPPSALEVRLFTDRALPFLHTFLDAVAPGRPAPVALTERDYPAPARSMVVCASITHGENVHPVQIEVLAHHLSDDDTDVDDARMQAICHEVPMELTFVFDTVQLTASQVARLEPGDVICLEHDLDRPLIGAVDGKPMVRARAGTSRRRVAVEVVDLIEGDEA